MKTNACLWFAIFCLAFVSDAHAQTDHSLQWHSLFGTAQVNGKAVQIESAQSSKSPAEALDKIKVLWKASGSHVISESKNGWDMVSRIHLGQLEVVQAKPATAGAYLMRHRASIEVPAQSPVVPDWLQAEGRVVFATQTSDAFQAGHSWLVELADQADGRQIIQRIAQRTKKYGYQEHPNFAPSQPFSAVRTNFGAAAQTVLSAEGGRQLLLQVIPNQNKAMLLVTQVQTNKLKERLQ